jgi:hypothetical protein
MSIMTDCMGTMIQVQAKQESGMGMDVTFTDLEVGG